MEYYYGQAWVMGKNINIRVKPEMITDGIVKEIELYLPVKVSGGWHRKRSRHDTPACREIWVEIDGARLSLKFR